MSHKFESGFTVGRPAWHRLDKNLNTYPRDWEQACEIAGVPEVAEMPLFDADGHEIEGYYGVKRTDTDALLTVQPSSYVLISREEMGTINNMILGDKYDIEALVVLDGGKIVVATVVLDEEWEIPGDGSRHIPFWVLSNRHDGRGGVRCGGSILRVECNNTATAVDAFWDRTAASTTIKHTSNWATKVQEVAEAVQFQRQLQENMRDMFTIATQYSISQAVVEEFLDKWSPTAISTDMTDRVRQNRLDYRQAFKDVLDGPTCEGIRGNAYGLLMAATQSRDHGVKSHSDDTEVKRLLLTSETPKRQAFSWVKKYIGYEEPSLVTV